MDPTAFYTTVTSISFTLLGLWWVVVEGRDTWKMNMARRRMAYVVSLHFVLPGVMSALALVAPDVGILWRITFVTASLLGLLAAGYVARTLSDEHDCPPTRSAIEWIAIPIYALIAVVAVVPEAVGRSGSG